MDMIAPEAIERRIEDIVISALSRPNASDYVERIGAAPIDDVESFRYTEFKDSGHGCVILLESGEQFAVTIRRLED